MDGSYIVPESPEASSLSSVICLGSDSECWKTPRGNPPKSCRGNSIIVISSDEDAGEEREPGELDVTPAIEPADIKKEENNNEISTGPVNTSTPLHRISTKSVSGTSSTATSTPLIVKYERIRNELSATKKEQKKFASVQEELKAELKELRQLRQLGKNSPEKIKIERNSDENDQRRPIVIDGSNIAMSHGNHKVFSCRGIALCIKYFQGRGHRNITALVPLHRKTAEASRACPIRDAHILDELENKGLLSFTPSRQLRGRRVTPYDDRFMLQLACRNGGVIVSNDNYRDLMEESAEFRRVVENRLIMYVFAGDDFMVPEDPLGRYGPRLEDVLKKDSAWSKMVSPTPAPRMVAEKSAPNQASGIGVTRAMMQGRPMSLVSGPVRQLRRSPRIHQLLSAQRYREIYNHRGVTPQMPRQATLPYPLQALQLSNVRQSLRLAQQLFNRR